MYICSETGNEGKICYPLCTIRRRTLTHGNGLAMSLTWTYHSLSHGFSFSLAYVRLCIWFMYILTNGLYGLTVATAGEADVKGALR